MNNSISLRHFKWSEKTYSILEKLHIFNIGDLKSITSLNSLKNFGVPKDTIKQMNDICNPTKTETNFKIYEFNFVYNYTYNPTEELGSYRCIATNKETALRSFEEFKAKNPNKNILREPILDETPVFDGMEIEDF
jgi:hypothetical protein